MHQPEWGWLADGPDAWIRTANAAGIDLVIAGHRHRFAIRHPVRMRRTICWSSARTRSRTLTATATELDMIVRDTEGSVVRSS